MKVNLMKHFFTPLAIVLSTLTPAFAIDGIPDAANWISNPSFELGSQECPVDWVFLNQHEITTGTWDATSARSGAQGVAVHGGSGLAYGRWITPYRIQFKPGERLRVSFWYRGTGASVYMWTRASELNEAGMFITDLTKYYKCMLGPTPATSEWTYVETEFVAPDYPSWGQLCLGGGGRDTCEFDDIFVARPDIVMVEPRHPFVVLAGDTRRITVYADTLRGAATNEVDWSVTSPGFALQAVSRSETQNVWFIDLLATNTGAADITVQASTNGGAPLSLSLPRYARVHAGTGGAFTFSVMTDLHFYRPGNNERNIKFGQLANSLNALDPFFGLALGDQLEIHSGYRDEEKKIQVNAVLEQFARVNAPIFATAGNHEIDKHYEGAGTQWYFEKLMDMQPFYSVEVDGTLVAGVDISAPGLCSREHGAAFTRAGQADWLAGVLGSYTGRLPIVAAHISPFTEFIDGDDRNLYLSLLYTNRVRAYLSGHLHYTTDRYVRNPLSDGAWGPPWPDPIDIVSSAEGVEKLSDTNNLVYLTTVTGAAFLLGGAPVNGYRYLWVQDQEIVWQDVLPISLSVARTSSAANVVGYTITNGIHKAISGLPLKAELPAGNVTATINETPTPVLVTTNLAGVLIAWVQADIPLNSTINVIVRAD